MECFRCLIYENYFNLSSTAKALTDLPTPQHWAQLRTSIVQRLISSFASFKEFFVRDRRNLCAFLKRDIFVEAYGFALKRDFDGYAAV